MEFFTWNIASGDITAIRSATYDELNPGNRATMVKAVQQEFRECQLALILRLLGSIVYRINEQQELFPARSSLQCGGSLSKSAPESFDKLLYVLVDRQKRIAQAIAGKVVDDVDQAALWKVSCILRCAVGAATKAIEQNDFVSLT